MTTIRHAALILSIFCIGFSGTAIAQTVPYKASGTGIYSPIEQSYTTVGNATHLGKFTTTGNLTVTVTENPLVSTFESDGDQVWIAANGDKLYATLSGEVTLVPLDPFFTTFTAVWEGEFVIVGGTGRFKKTTSGPLTVSAINEPFGLNDPFWLFDWTVNGQIKLR